MHVDLSERCEKSAKEAGHVLPSSPINPSCKSCVAYHMKGMCSEACLNAGDHGDHTREQYLPLWEWCRLALPSAGAPAKHAGIGHWQGGETSAPCASDKPVHGQ